MRNPARAPRQRRTRRRLPLLLLAPLCFALACSSSGGSSAADENETATAGRGRLLILAPMNFDSVLSENLTDGIPKVNSALVVALRRHGYTVKTVRLKNFRRLFSDAAGDSFDLGDEQYAEAMRKILARLAPGDPDALIALPSIELRNAPTVGGGARFDGVARTLHKRGLPRDYDASTGAGGSLTGVSAHVRIWDASGRKLQDGYGGIELLTVLDFDVPNMRVQWTNERDDLFENPRFIREGVRKALDPFVPEG